MIRIYRHIVFALLLMIPMVLSAASKEKSRKLVKAKVNKEAYLSYNDKLRYKYFLYEAARQQNAGEYDAAFDLLQHAKSINPQAAEVYYMLALYYSDLKKDSLSLSYLETAVKLNPDNLTFVDYAARAYIHATEYDKAIDFYKLLAQKNHKDVEPLQMLVRLYQQQKNYQKMMETLERIELQEGPSLEITINKMNVYQLMGDQEKAYKELKTFVDKHPNDGIYKVMLGNWLVQNDRVKEAYKYYMAVLKDEPDNNEALSSLYDYYTVTKQDSLSEKLLRQLLSSDKTSGETKGTLFGAFIQKTADNGGDSTKVLKLLDDILKNKQKNTEILELKSAYMRIVKMPVDSINATLLKVLELSPDNASARVQLVQNLWDKQEYDSVLTMCEPALQYNPDELAFYYYSGMAMVQKEKNDAALDYFKKGVAQINGDSNPAIVSEFYAVMGDLLHQKGLADEAFAAYDSCLQWKDDNLSCLNNYAYYLSEEYKQLDKAEEMSHKTVVAEPKNATFLDTYAWILFCRERYSDAKQYIDQTIACLDSTGNNAIILEHAGDIYYMNGIVDKAVYYWEKALKTDASNALLAKKIKNKKYFKE